MNWCVQKEKLVALIYPHFDSDAFANGLQQTDVERMMEANRNATAIRYWMKQT